MPSVRWSSSRRTVTSKVRKRQSVPSYVPLTTSDRQSPGKVVAIESFLPNPDQGVPCGRTMVVEPTGSLYSLLIPDTSNEERMVEYTERYTPAETNGGWPFATGVIVTALVCIA